MKILFLANRVPYPPFRGDKLKIYNLAKRLCGKHELHLLTFAQSEEDFTYKAELEKIFTQVTFVSLPKWKSALNCIGGIGSRLPFQVLYFRSAAMHRALDQVLTEHRFDAVHVQHLRMAQYMSQRKELPRILDLPDAFSLYWKRKYETSRNGLIRAFEGTEQRRVLRYEQEILHRFNKTLVCSVEDKKYLEETHGLSNMDLLPNGVDTSVFFPDHHDYEHCRTLLFTGNMDYGPNVDAVSYFASEILPLIRHRHPDVHFVIAGQRPVPKVHALAGSSISVTGFIPNLAEEYNKASVVVAPLRFGAGTQNKVLEAMAMGIPVVCSNIGFAGLGIRSGEGAIMQTDPQCFADAVCALLEDAAYRRRVGEQGISVIQSRFSWDRIAVQLEAQLQSIQH